MSSRYSIDKSIIASCLTLCLNTTALAVNDSSPDLAEDYFLGDVPMVLSASRLAQPVSESPAAMTIIDREIIEASGAIDIPDVLRLVPGFQVSHISGANQTAQYHGIANQHPKRMQVLIDGRSVYHSAFGGVHWDSLPITLDDVERIEVLRGSNASAYGSNAFMGVVNIVTRHASQDQGAHVSLLNGYSGTREAEFRFGDRIGQLDYRFTISQFETDGFPNVVGKHNYWDTTGPNVDPSTIATGTDLVSDQNRADFTLAREDSQAIGRFNLRGDYLMENGDSLLFELGYVHNDRDNTLQNGKYEYLRPDENLRTNSQLLKWSRQLPDSSELSLQFSHNRLDFNSLHTDTLIDRGQVDADPSVDAINAGPTVGGYKFQNDRYDLELQHTLPEIGGWRTVWGAGLRLDRLKGFNLIIDNRDIERAQYRLFANTEKHFGNNAQWILNAGLMLEHQQNLGNYASPRISINYHVDELNSIRFAVARAYRMPSFYEQSGEIDLFDASTLSNPNPFYYTGYSSRGVDIKPEELRSVELGWFVAPGKEGVSLDARIFYEQLTNYIDSVNHEGGCTTCDPYSLATGAHDIWINENAGWMDISGVDLHANIKVSDRTSFIASSSMTRPNGKRIHKRNGLMGPITDDQAIDNFVPTLTVSALWSHRFDEGWAGSVGLYHMSMMNWPNDGDRLEPYDRVDLRIAKKFRMGRGNGEVELIAQNVLDNPYIEFRLDNRFERRIYLRLKMDID